MLASHHRTSQRGTLKSTGRPWHAERTSRALHVAVGLLLMVVCATSAKTAIVNARSVSMIDVSTAVNAAAAGDTVQIPAGTATWTSPVVLNKGIQIIGAGIDRTVIINALSGGRKDAAAFRIAVSNGQPLFRLSGLTINGVASDPVASGTATIQIGGDTEALRIDHVRWNGLRQWSVALIGASCGVIDHCVLEGNCIYESMIMSHGSWNGKSAGDGSWADDPYWASGKEIYIEDCVLNATAAAPWVVDALPPGGARYVMRHCTISGAVSSHGTDTSARNRSCRLMEVYNNRIVFPGTSQGPNAIIVRGGAATIFNNYITNYSVPITTWVYGLDFRRGPWWGYKPGWGPADGANPWDLNIHGTTSDYNGRSISPVATDNFTGTGRGDIYASGVYNGATQLAATSITLPISSPSADCWRGFTVRNLGQLARYNAGQANNDWWHYITSNTAQSGGMSTLTLLQDSQGFRSSDWRAGDHWEIRKVDVVLDQSGRGKGDLLSGTFGATTNTVAGQPRFPNEAAEGIYQWNNSMRSSGSGSWSAVNSVSSRYVGQIRQNRDWFSAVRPGYPWDASTSNTPANRVGADTDPGAFYVRGSGGFPYPHPLITGAAMPSPTATPSASPAAPSPPTNLTVSPGS